MLAIYSLFLVQILSIFQVSDLLCQVTPQSLEKSPLIGTWSVQQVHWISADTTYSIEKAQPGYFMFGSSSYSLMWTPTSKSRIPFTNLANPTNSEMQSGFQSVVFNAGDYVVNDSTLVGTARIAKVPGFEGGQQFYHFKIDDQTMRLTMYDENLS